MWTPARSAHHCTKLSLQVELPDALSAQRIPHTCSLYPVASPYSFSRAFILFAYRSAPAVRIRTALHRDICRVWPTPTALALSYRSLFSSGLHVCSIHICEIHVPHRHCQHYFGANAEYRHNPCVTRRQPALDLNPVFIVATSPLFVYRPPRLIEISNASKTYLLYCLSRCSVKEPASIEISNRSKLFKGLHTRKTSIFLTDHCALMIMWCLRMKRDFTNGFVSFSL